MTSINTEGNDSFKEVKQANFRGAIAAGLASALVGGMLGAVVGELSSGLAGAAVGGLLGAAIGRQKKVKFPTGKQVDIYLKAKAIYASPLRKALPHQRHKALLCDAEMRELDRDSFTLAVARYMKEHPLVTDIPIGWLDFEQVSKWQAMSTAELQDEASRRLEQLEKWDKFAKANHPDVWEAYRIRYINVWLNLHSVYSGLFPSAMGNMAIFLDAVGASFEEIHLF